MQEDKIRLCEELEWLFEFTEGRITLAEYHQKMKDLEDGREEMLKKAGILAE